MDGAFSSLRMGKVSYVYKIIVGLNWKKKINLVDLDVEDLYTILRDIYQGTKIFISATVRALDLRQLWD